MHGRSRRAGSLLGAVAGGVRPIVEGQAKAEARVFEGPEGDKDRCPGAEHAPQVGEPGAQLIGAAVEVPVRRERRDVGVAGAGELGVGLVIAGRDDGEPGGDERARVPAGAGGDLKDRAVEAAGTIAGDECGRKRMRPLRGRIGHERRAPHSRRGW